MAHQSRKTVGSRQRRVATALISTGLIAWLLLGTSASSTNAGASHLARAVAGVEASADEPREIWWNEEWARIVGTQGSLAMESSVDRVVLRPEGRTSRLDILSRLTGRVHSYSFDPAGQVILAHGWIMISTAGPCALSAAPVRDAPSAAALQGNPTRDGNKAFVEFVELHGEVEWEVQSPPDPGSRFRLVSRHPVGAPQNSIVMQFTWGDTTRLTSHPDYPLFTLTLNRRRELGDPRANSMVSASTSRLR